jgi:hypothetical protein
MLAWDSAPDRGNAEEIKNLVLVGLKKPLVVGRNGDP